MFFRGTSSPPATLHERFEQQVKLHPREIALESDGVRLTYRELNQDANRMARRLVAARVEADGLVLVAMERSCELVVTLLAVLKAGGAFVILDGSLPSRQREAFIQASGADVIVTDSGRPFVGLRTVRYFAVSGEDHNLYARAQADRWACVVAGKVRSHETVLKILDATREEEGFRAGDGVFSAADLSGLAAIDLFLPLTCGGRLVVATKPELRDPERLEAVIGTANCKFVRRPKPLAFAMGSGGGAGSSRAPAF